MQPPQSGWITRQILLDNRKFERLYFFEMKRFQSREKMFCCATSACLLLSTFSRSWISLFLYYKYRLTHSTLAAAISILFFKRKHFCYSENTIVCYTHIWSTLLFIIFDSVFLFNDSPLWKKKERKKERKSCCLTWHYIPIVWEL